MNPQPRFKTILLGDAGIGKSSFLRRHVNGEFDHRYAVTFPYTYNFDIKFATNYGNIVFDVLESAGSENFGPLRDMQV